MKKFLTAVFLLGILTSTASAQLFGPAFTDLPQHGFALGAGIGPTTKDFSAILGYAEKISSATGTYSYSGFSIVPSLVANQNGGKSLSITPVAHTGIKQLIMQNGRFTVAVDGGAGVSLPSPSTGAFNLAGVAGVDLIWRLNKDLRSSPGQTNNYIALEPQFTQLTGTPGGTVVSIGVAWVHGIN